MDVYGRRFLWIQANDLALAIKCEETVCLQLRSKKDEWSLYFTTMHLPELEDLVRKLKEVRDCKPVGSVSLVDSLVASSLV